MRDELKDEKSGKKFDELAGKDENLIRRDMPEETITNRNNVKGKTQVLKGTRKTQVTRKCGFDCKREPGLVLIRLQRLQRTAAFGESSG